MHELVGVVRSLHLRIRADALSARDAAGPAAYEVWDDPEGGDTQYQVDRIAEHKLLELVEELFGPWLPVVLISEGLPDAGFGYGTACIPNDSDPASANLCIIVDPIDGTRGLMYDKRSAWILTGIADLRGRRGQPARLSDLGIAVQTEIPTSKQGLVDTLWAVRGRGAHAVRTRIDGSSERSFELSSSTAQDVTHGFGQVMRAFPGGRDVLAAVDDDMYLNLIPSGRDQKALVFEDQYISTGGQIAELAYGHDRWTADLRPLLAPVLAKRGMPAVLCCKPYDICTALVAVEAGAVLESPTGGALDAPLDATSDVSWVGYANPRLADRVRPALVAAMKKHGITGD